MAKLIGLGGVSTKVKETIGEVQSKVDKPVDKVIDMIVSKGEAFVEKGKEAVSAGVEKVKNFLFPSKKFKAGKEEHTIFFKEGAKPVLMLASAPIEFKKYIEESNTLTPEQKNAANALVDHIVKLAESSAAETDVKKQADLNKLIDGKQTELSEIVKGDPKLAGETLEVEDHDDPGSTNSQNDGSIKNWGAHLESFGKDAIGATRPKADDPNPMTRPHAHHIVFKGAYRNNDKMKDALARSRKVVEEAGLNWYQGRENLVWAPNIAGQHNTANAEKVAQKLEDTADSNGKYSGSEVQSVLKKLGEKFADGGGI